MNDGKRSDGEEAKGDQRVREPLIHRCPLCGKQFSEGEVKCSGCLLSKNCNLLCCPHCGYSYKERSAIVDFVKHFLGRKVKP
jgi:hypothetical protein